MADFVVGGPDVRMDGVVFRAEDSEEARGFGKESVSETDPESPRSPLYPHPSQFFPGRKMIFPPYVDSDDSEDSDHFQSRGSELMKLKGRLSKLSVGREDDQEDEATSTASARESDATDTVRTRQLHKVKTMPLTDFEKAAVIGKQDPPPIVENAPSRPTPPVPWPINKVLSPIRTKLDPSSPRSSRSPSPAELPPEPMTPRAWERSEASQIFTPPAHSHLPGDGELEELLRNAPAPGKSPLRVSS